MTVKRGRFKGWTRDKFLRELARHRNVAASLARACGVHKNTLRDTLHRQGIRVSELEPRFGNAIGRTELAHAVAETGGVRGAARLLKTSASTIARLLEKYEMRTPQSRGRRGDRCLRDVGTDELLALFRAQRWNLAACSRALGYSTTTVRAVARERGIPFPPRSSAHANELPMPTKRRLEELYLTRGLGASRIARMLTPRVDTNTVLKWLRACEIPVRRPNGWRSDVDYRRRDYPVRVAETVVQ